MSEYPTPDDVERDLAAQRAQKLGDEAQSILDGGGSHESLELAEEVVAEMASATRKALTGKAGNEPISSDEMLKESRRWIENGENPYPLLSMDESKELLGYLQDRGPRTPQEHERSSFLQRKAVGRI